MPTAPSAPRAPILPLAHPDRREIARFLREQPPLLVPTRTDAAGIPGLVAFTVLGYRVIRRYEV